MRHITFEEMINTELQDILNGFRSGYCDYYYKDGDGDYHKIIELDLLRGRFGTDNGDFSEFEWEIEESNIYMEEHKKVSSKR